MMFPFSYFPVLASEHGGQIDRLLIIFFVFLFFIFIAWLAFFTIALIRFRQGRNPAARPEQGSGAWVYGLALAMFLAELVIHFGLGGGLSAAELAAAPTNANTVQVRVLAQQFAWNIHYPGADGVFGRTSPTFYNDQDNPVGLDPADAFGDDDIVTFKQLYLPVNRPVRIELSTKDVIHSFYLPEFRVKQDVIPGMTIPVVFVPSMTTEQFREIKKDPARDFEIACAQLCGLTHYAMKGTVHVLEPEAFEAWLQEKAPPPDDYDDDAWAADGL